MIEPDREEALFVMALELSAAERTAFLDRECAGDTVLRQRLTALLEAHEDGESFKELDPSAAALPFVEFGSRSSEEVGRMVGCYRLVERIGAGGFGEVWAADQQAPLRRRVALKVIKLGMDTRQVVARFEAERQALAMMEHPNIARVLDAGTTEAGRPFFVMELVQGMEMTRYCDQERMDLKGRLQLFGQVCQAIQHAHQKGVIHRDIKPSNVMVAVQDGVPVPKIIDFGIAKATQQKLTEDTVFARTGDFIGTPAYMSPEQADMNGLDIDTRSDIYSLGVLLYELLAGCTPFDARELRAAGYDAMRRMIREKVPPCPSARLAARPSEERALAASQRSAEDVKLVRQLKGDLDWIVMKCLEKDRSRRYETAVELAADLARYLAHEEVLARPPSTAYRLRKAFCRHRIAFSSAVTIALMLLVGIVVTTRESRRANRLERIAEARLVESEKSRSENQAIISLLTEIFQHEDAQVSDGRSGSMAEALDTAVRRLDLEFADRPDRRAQLQITLASSYVRLRQPASALSLFEQARDYYVGRYGPDHEGSIKAAHGMANCYQSLNRTEEAGTLRQSVLERCRRVYGLEHPTTVAAMHNFAQGHSDANALSLREEVVRLSRKVNGLDHGTTYAAMWNLQLSYSAVGEVPEAYQLSTDLTLLGLKRYGADASHVTKQLHRAEVALYDGGRWQEALRLRSEFTRLAKADASVDLPALLAWFGQTNEFEAICRSFNERALSKRSVGTAERAAKSCSLLPGRSPELREQALSLGRYAVDQGKDHPHRYWCLIALGMAEYRAGNFTAAEQALALGDELSPKKGGEHPKATARLYRAMCLGRMGDTNAALLAFTSAAPKLLPLPEDEFAPLKRGEGNDLVVWLALEEAGVILGIPPSGSSPVETWLSNLEQSVARHPEDNAKAMHLALTHLWLGKDAEHRDLCRRLLASVAESESASSHDRAAKVLLLHPSPDPELLKRAVESAGKALSLAKTNDDWRPWYQLVVALADSRIGKAAEAEALLTEVESTTRNCTRRGLALAIRARVRWKEGRMAEARADLAEVDRLGIPDPDPRHVTFVLRKPDYLALYLAAREARALLIQK